MKVPLHYEPYLLLNDYNLLKVEGTRSDPAEITNDNHCYKFVNLDYATRILVNFDPKKMNP